MKRHEDIDKILEGIIYAQTPLFKEDELELTAGLSSLKEGGNAILKALMYKRTSRKKPLCDLLPPLNDYIDMLRGFDTAIKTITDPETKKSFKCLEYIFRIDVISLSSGTRDFTDEQMKYREDFFNKIDDLPKDNVFRRAFVEAYIDEQVYTRFYEEKEKEAGRFDTDEEGDNYTPEGAKEWDEHYNALCEEYGETEYKRLYDDPSEYYTHISSEAKLYYMNEDNFTQKALEEVNSFYGKETNR